MGWILAFAGPPLEVYLKAAELHRQRKGGLTPPDSPYRLPKELEPKPEEEPR